MPHEIWSASGWLLWGFTALAFAGFVRGMRDDAHRGQPVHIVQITQALMYLALALIFLFIGRSKLHLLWLLPTTYLLAYLDFIVLRVPGIGKILRMMIVLPGWLLLAGTDGVIRGVPHGK